MTIKLGLQIPNFSYGTGGAELFPTVIAQAREAEAAGFDAAFLMDHFYQLPMLGSPDEPMLEAYTALGALAAATRRIQLGTLVTGNSYRNPTLLAKALTTLDVVSQGRAILGIGTGWYELEHNSLGFDFGTFTERFNKLEESLQIIVPMLRGERPTFSGKYYRTHEAIANPRYRDHIPLMIGASGVKKTIPFAAQHFDHLNISVRHDELPSRVKAARQRCEEIGRNPSTLEISALVPVAVDENLTDDFVPPQMQERMLVGSAERIADQIKTKIFDAGADGVILYVSTHIGGHQPGNISAIGDALRPLLGR